MHRLRDRCSVAQAALLACPPQKAYRFRCPESLFLIELVWLYELAFDALQLLVRAAGGHGAAAARPTSPRNRVGHRAHWQ